VNKGAIIAKVFERAARWDAQERARKAAEATAHHAKDRAPDAAPGGAAQSQRQPHGDS
jgi:hypothetical protein